MAYKYTKDECPHPDYSKELIRPKD